MKQPIAPLSLQATLDLIAPIDGPRDTLPCAADVLIIGGRSRWTHRC